MALTEQELALVQGSFQKVMRMVVKVTQLFYARLFEIDPSTKPLFAHVNMPNQGLILMKTLSTAVSSLDNMAILVPLLEDLGKQHITYGVIESQYASVGEALLWTLEQGLGDEFTPEVKAAWAKAYSILAEVACRAYRK